MVLFPQKSSHRTGQRAFAVGSICKRPFSVYTLEAKFMTTEVASVRLPHGTVVRLRMLAHKRSLERTQDLSWSDILREAIVKLLDDENERGGHHVQQSN